MKIAEGAFGFVLLIVFIGWIFIAGSPHTRLERACSPVAWTGRATLATVALIHKEWEKGTERFFQKTDYDCQYILWNQFYSSDWKRMQKRAAAAARARAAKAWATP